VVRFFVEAESVVQPLNSLCTHQYRPVYHYQQQLARVVRLTWVRPLFLHFQFRSKHPSLLAHTSERTNKQYSWFKKRAVAAAECAEQFNNFHELSLTIAAKSCSFLAVLLLKSEVWRFCVACYCTSRFSRVLIRRPSASLTCSYSPAGASLVVDHL